MQMNDSVSPAEFREAPVPPFLASQIELAATMLEVDVAASRECLQRAVALLRVWDAERAPRGSHAQLAAWQIKRLLSYIEVNLLNSICAQDLSDLVDLSASHLSRAFKASLGFPPHQFVLRRRIGRAKDLLKDTQLSLAQIALDCGFCDQSSLSRQFRRFVGQTPHRWRRENLSLGGRRLALEAFDMPPNVLGAKLSAAR
jgi:AraC family transcriptional regulator